MQKKSLKFLQTGFIFDVGVKYDPDMFSTVLLRFVQVSSRTLRYSHQSVIEVQLWI